MKKTRITLLEPRKSGKFINYWPLTRSAPESISTLMAASIQHDDLVYIL